LNTHSIIQIGKAHQINKNFFQTNVRVGSPAEEIANPKRLPLRPLKADIRNTIYGLRLDTELTPS
jgi:hypothetical protein